MGHTVSSQRQVVERIVSELNDYGRALRLEDRDAFERLLAMCYKHYGEISYTSSYHTWALMLFSIILEQEKRLIGCERVKI